MPLREITTSGPEETIRFATHVGQKLQGGECLELISDVGGGKTTFVRGITAGAGSSSHVSSPTFTISKVYETPKFNIAHFDFYRLQDAGMIDYEIEEVVHDGKAVIIVEWSEIVRHVLPKDRVQIQIKTKSENEREFTIRYPKSRGYLFEETT